MVNKITIVGYGSQAKTWASNLRESGVDVTIVLRQKSPSIEKAHNDEMRVFEMPMEKPKNLGEYIVILTPDHTHEEIIQNLKPSIKEGTTFVFAHGFSQLKHNFKDQFPHMNFTLLAPKAIASEMRDLYKQSKTFPGAISVENSSKPKDDKQFLLLLAKKLGMNIPTEVTFEEETICDLFSEQSLLCSLLPYGIRYAFEALRNRNISSEMAFNECLFESKLIIQTLEKVGFERFFEIISPNALIGGEKAKNSSQFQGLNVLFEKLLDDISSRKFYEEVDNSNVSELRQKVLRDWKNSEITHEWKRQNNTN